MRARVQWDYFEKKKKKKIEHTQSNRRSLVLATVGWIRTILQRVLGNVYERKNKNTIFLRERKAFVLVVLTAPAEILILYPLTCPVHRGSGC